jgi:FlaA1/EpsC-like NDP-sugar epimerase
MRFKFRLITLIILDSVTVLLSIFLSHVFINPLDFEIDFLIVTSSIVLIISHHFLSYKYHIYKRVWKYANIDELMGLCKVITLSIFITAIFQLIAFQVYERALLLTWILHIVLLCGVRLSWRHIQLSKEKKSSSSNLFKLRTLIIGAGNTGRNIVSQLQKTDANLNPIVFLDDNPDLKNMEILGVPIVGGFSELESVVDHYKINHIIIAIPSLNREKLEGLVVQTKRFTNNVQILPSYVELATGDIQYSKVRDVSIEDLLGRNPVTLNNQTIYKKLQSKKVLVTGAGGSIGSELCRQIIKYNPSELILLDHSEFNIYTILTELTKLQKKVKISTEIMSVENRERIFLMMQKHKPDIVFHAAAYKHVPLMEENYHSAISTNIFGTKNVADAASEASVENFVLISTDKAVNPSNIMGMTKRIAELIVNEKNISSNTKYSSVRFGNVLGSSGSVVPLFKSQIEAGGPITVTHPEMTRYFMTIPEAAQLVLQAASFANGSEVFVLDMGEPVKILDLAKKLITLSGLSEKEIEIQYSGIRDGEKLHEELFYEYEEKSIQVHPKIKAFLNEEYTLDVTEKLTNHLFLTKEQNEQLLMDILNRKIRALI